MLSGMRCVGHFISPVDGLDVHASLDSRGTAVAVRILRLDAYCPVATLALLLDVTALYTSIECHVFFVFDFHPSEIVIVIVHVFYFSCVMDVLLHSIRVPVMLMGLVLSSVLRTSSR